MMSVVVDDNIFTVEQKLPSEEKSSQVYPTLLPDAFYRYVTHSSLFLQCLEESGWRFRVTLGWEHQAWRAGLIMGRCGPHTHSNSVN